jgi:hypothetical protein
MWSLFLFFNSVVHTYSILSYVLHQLLYWLADWQINVFMVVDSTDAHNYDSWQNNVYGTGAKVCSFSCFAVVEDLSNFAIITPHLLLFLRIACKNEV